MKEDLTIKEIRTVRKRISAKYGHSPKKLVEHYIKLQKRHSKRISELALPHSE